VARCFSGRTVVGITRYLEITGVLVAGILSFGCPAIGTGIAAAPFTASGVLQLPPPLNPDDGPYPTSVAVDRGGKLFVSTWTAIYRMEPAGTLVRIAGDPRASGFAGDGGPATSARFFRVTCIVFDSAGNLFIADTGNHRIRKVTPEGMITTVAGGGSRGRGDGGTGTEAQLSEPGALAFDASGNLYIADVYVILKLATTGMMSGIISRFAGDPGSGDSGDRNQATSADLLWVSGIAVSPSQELYIAAYAAGPPLKKVSTDGVISTVLTVPAGANSGAREQSGQPLRIGSRLAFDSAGNLYFVTTGREVRIETPTGSLPAVEGNCMIKRMTPAGVVSLVAGTGHVAYSGDGGPAIRAELTSPGALAVDVQGNIYFTDSGCRRVRKIAPTGIISTVVGDGTSKCFLHAGTGGGGLYN
jgi:hypothetical protein